MTTSSTLLGSAACIGLTFAFALSSCASREEAEPVGAADCSAQVRVNGVVYTSHGYSDQQATRFAPADQAECHDGGEEPAGSVFPDDPGQVTTWTFQGYPPQKVLGVRFDEESFAVFVADNVSERESERIFEALAKPR